MKPLTEDDLFAGGVKPLAVLLAPELQSALDTLAREVAVNRELLELVVDWAGARDRVPPPDWYDAARRVVEAYALDDTCLRGGVDGFVADMAVAFGRESGS